MLTHFDPSNPDFIANPYPTYAQLRQTQPIFYRDDWGMWVITTHEDVTTLLRDKRLGRSILHVLTREQLGWPPASDTPFDQFQRHVLMDMEPPDHTRLRSLVHKAFTSRQVENLRGRIETISHALIDTVIHRGEMELIADFAMPLPVMVIAELLGVPPEGRARLQPWSADIIAMYELAPTPAQVQQANQAVTEFSAYLRELVTQRRQQPQDDLITQLVQVEEAGERLTEAELISTCIFLLNAGHEATVNGIGNGMYALLGHPTALAQLQADPSLIKTAVEEMLRYDSPLQLFRRWVLEDMTYKGHVFKQGTELAFLYGSANRDEARFPHADQFDITRADNRHVTFGQGIHYCLGAPLARLELQVAISTLLQRLPNLHLYGAPPSYHPKFVFRYLQDLSVRF